MDPMESFDCLEIIEQSALNHFTAVLQEVQRIAAEAVKNQPQKRPKKYDGKLARTLKRRKKHKEDLAKQGFFSVFEFIAQVDNKAKKKAHLEQLVAKALEGEQELEESEQESEESVQVLEESMHEELDTRALISKCMGQMHYQVVLIYCV